MNRAEIRDRVYIYTRDPQRNLYPERSVYEFINEGISRCRTYIDEFYDMPFLKYNTDIPQLLPVEYHHLLALYSAARCFDMEERFYQATQKMNEFEIKLDELRTRIRNGELIIIDAEGNPRNTLMSQDEYVSTKEYWGDFNVYQQEF